MNIQPRRIAVALLVAMALMIAIGFWLWPRPVEYSIDYKMPGNPGPKIAAAQAAAIERRERIIDQTIWKKEMEAEEYGRVFEDFWDRINAGTNGVEVAGASQAGAGRSRAMTNKWGVVEELKFGEMVWGIWKEKEDLGHGIERWLPQTNSETRHLISFGLWREQIEGWKAAGWEIMQCEFRHNAFDPQTNDIPAKSKFYFSVHLTNAAPARATVEGDLFVEWNLREVHSMPTIAKVDSSSLAVMFRGGPPAFVPVLEDTIPLPRTNAGVEPLIVYDVDGDGVSEIILAGINRIYRRRTNGVYHAERFASTPSSRIISGLIADFDGDDIPDFLYADYYGLYLIKGTAGGRFAGQPRIVSPGLDVWKEPRCITCGDVDGDGDLDLFVGQYKGPYVDAAMPTPYYDANDSFPSYLLINNGKGDFTDGTAAAGLAVKQNRHILVASLVDLNSDGALDLLTSSDFAGADLFLNDGKGHFHDATDHLQENHAFGMGQVVTDFNNDGLLDLLVTGMNSPTANRLEHLGMTRERAGLDPRMRSKMNWGSRLLFGEIGGRFAEGALSRSVARTGWSWGVAAADFDNDGWPDVYIANGMESLRTARDYEGEFWLHDIFVSGSEAAPGAAVYFEGKGKRTRGRGLSYGGFDKNRLLLNRSGASFLEVAHLFGVALEEDSRNVVVDDLDRDGRSDIVVTSISVKPTPRFTLHIFENHLDAGNWIEFGLPSLRSSIGAQITLNTQNNKMVRQLTTGDSYRSQSPLNVHFGLGGETSVVSTEIRWMGGAKTIIRNPAINHRHVVSKNVGEIAD